MPRVGARFRSVLTAAIAAALVAACGAGGSDRATPPAPGGDAAAREIGRPAGAADTTALLTGLNRFGLEYFALVGERSGDENVVLSPLSIGLAFGMAEAGARGETAAEIARVFHFPSSDETLHPAFEALVRELGDSGDSTLRVANRIYPAAGYELVSAFVSTLAASYRAPLEPLDFAGDPEAARERINAWVAERTEGRIRDLLAPGMVDPQTALVLVNALYLEARWSQPFLRDATGDAPFTRPDGSVVDAALMRNPRLHTRFVETAGYQAVELPYGDGELAMTIVVPRGDDFAEFERAFDVARLARVDAAMREGVVDLALPRWSSSFEVDLVETLPELGLTVPFRGGDFTGISPENPSIGEAVHAAEIEVDEDGTVAAAATAVGFEVSATIPDATIRADRPFLYLIRHAATGAVLFLGRVSDPAAGEPS